MRKLSWNFVPAVFRNPLSPECEGEHATLRRSKVRFDSWRGHLRHQTLKPDGRAIGCGKTPQVDPIEVGSIPTGVFFRRERWHTPSSGAQTTPVRVSLCVFRAWFLTGSANVG